MGNCLLIISYCELEFYRVFSIFGLPDREQLKPQKDGKGTPLCMEQFHRLFNTCKIPGVLKDHLVEHFHSGKDLGIVALVFSMSLVKCKSKTKFSNLVEMCIMTNFPVIFLLIIIHILLECKSI